LSKPLVINSLTFAFLLLKESQQSKIPKEPKEIAFGGKKKANVGKEVYQEWKSNRKTTTLISSFLILFHFALKEEKVIIIKPNRRLKQNDRKDEEKFNS